MALLRSDPFRDVDRLFQQLAAQPGPRASMSMPIDAYRKGDQFLIQMELPGIDLDRVDITVEDNVLTVKADRPAPATSEDVESLVTERSYGSFSRQLFLGRNLDTDRIEAQYDAGVLSLSIPVAEHAKARRIPVETRSEPARLAV